jgi:hypothetical protein
MVRVACILVTVKVRRCVRRNIDIIRMKHCTGEYENKFTRL